MELEFKKSVSGEVTVNGVRFTLAKSDPWIVDEYYKILGAAGKYDGNLREMREFFRCLEGYLNEALVSVENDGKTCVELISCGKPFAFSDLAEWSALLFKYIWEKNERYISQAYE
ncbi:hypothetical protein FACS1894219_12430 [Clostridia bacterium]|nr:hypothetical protein FACS1894219_12430 [Clostridia bacterium]